MNTKDGGFSAIILISLAVMYFVYQQTLAFYPLFLMIFFVLFSVMPSRNDRSFENKYILFALMSFFSFCFYAISYKPSFESSEIKLYDKTIAHYTISYNVIREELSNKNNFYRLHYYPNNEIAYPLSNCDTKQPVTIRYRPITGGRFTGNILYALQCSGYSLKLSEQVASLNASSKSYVLFLSLFFILWVVLPIVFYYLMSKRRNDYLR